MQRGGLTVGVLLLVGLLHKILVVRHFGRLNLSRISIDINVAEDVVVDFVAVWWRC